jgi:membrane protease YdiL (CAAX protease family)
VPEPVEDEAPERRIRWGMGDAVIGMVLSLVLSTIGVGVLLAALDTELVDDLPLWAITIAEIPLWLGLLAPVWWASTRKGLGSLRADFGLEMRPRDIPIGLAAGVVAQIAIGLASTWIYDLLGADTDKLGETAEELADRAVGAGNVVLLVLVVVVGAPIVEELFYRGLWMRSLERRTGSPAVALVVSSLIFGIAHFQPWDLIALAPAGLVFGYLAQRFGRLGPAIWAHVGFNALAVVALLAG